MTLFHFVHLSGINIMLNLFELFRSGIVEIQDIVVELIVHMPLSKHQ
jgi:hypothetical protein